MKCLLCGFEFDEREAQNLCKGCVFFSSCGLVKCPNCGYETPEEPMLIKKLKKWKEKRDAIK
ncbi:MAG: hypothetical protein N2246_05190 [Candidatus Sumerlaeia bacterium]|nr:hypothetical protein [Candidatus Sumerlaeia bacterium]